MLAQHAAGRARARNVLNGGKSRQRRSRSPRCGAAIARRGEEASRAAPRRWGVLGIRERERGAGGRDRGGEGVGRLTGNVAGQQLAGERIAVVDGVDGGRRGGLVDGVKADRDGAAAVERGAGRVVAERVAVAQVGDADPGGLRRDPRRARRRARAR